MDALGNSDEDLTIGGIDALHIGDKLLHVKVQLRQINQVGAGAELGGQGRTGSKPAGVTAHDLHHGDHAVIINSGVLIDLHAGGGNILC